MSAGFPDGSNSLNTPSNQRGWLFRLTHGRPRPRRGYHRSRQERQFDMSAMTDFESMNLVIFTTSGIAVVLIAALWWQLLS
jgi:hypothetical protein